MSCQTHGIQTICAEWKGNEMRRTDVALISLIGLLPTITGCVDSMAKYERQVELTAPLTAGSTFSAHTRDGSITVRGVETSECRLTATIVARGATSEQAQSLAEQVSVTLEPDGTGLAAVIQGPSRLGRLNYSVSLDATVPSQTSLSLRASDGAIRLTGIQGDVAATTSDGSVHVEDIDGTAHLRTSDGSITGRSIDAQSLELHTSDGSITLDDVRASTATAETSDGSIILTTVRAETLGLRTNDGSIRGEGISAKRLNCRTSDGSIRIECSPEAPPDLDATLVTSDGSITFLAPPNLSVDIDASATDGSIKTDLPILVTGRIDKQLRGTVGSGEGRLFLKTHDGSISIRSAR
jgi:hypothetical protein